MNKCSLQCYLWLLLFALLSSTYIDSDWHITLYTICINTLQLLDCIGEKEVLEPVIWSYFKAHVVPAIMKFQTPVNDDTTSNSHLTKTAFETELLLKAVEKSTQSEVHMQHATKFNTHHIKSIYGSRCYIVYSYAG